MVKTIKSIPNNKVCSQCKYPLTKEWQEYGKLKFCLDCWNWQMEASDSGVATCGRYTQDKELNCWECQSCEICQARKKISNISTIVLAQELFYRKDFNALITWEDDSFVVRFQELIWELKQVKGWTSEQIETEVNQDIFGDKKISQRKFSRGT